MLEGYFVSIEHVEHSSSLKTTFKIALCIYMFLWTFFFLTSVHLLKIGLLRFNLKYTILHIFTNWQMYRPTKPSPQSRLWTCALPLKTSHDPLKYFPLFLLAFLPSLSNQICFLLLLYSFVLSRTLHNWN